jgi:MoaA/NifB/PqqE/SkfB family radical SAM enzyme
MTNELKRINIELTSRCNYACMGCPTHGLLRGKGAMDSELYKSIFNETGNNLDRIFLWGYGEPLLHLQAIELIRYARSFSTKKVMSTTGWRFENLSDINALTNLDELIVSINGITPEVYKLHQVNGDLEKVIRGLERVAPVLANSDTRFIMQTVAHKGNIDEIPQTEEFARKYGFDMLVIKSFNVMDRKQETFEKFVPIGTPYSRYQNGLSNPPKKPQNKVYPCEEWMVINWDGSVNPCCWDYRGEHNLGNVKDMGVYGVWNNLRALKHRAEIKKGNFLEICVDCANSKTVDTISFTNKGGKDVKKSI